MSEGSETVISQTRNPETVKITARLIHWDYLLAVIIFSVVSLQGLTTIHQVGISDDEPYYYGKSKAYLDWFTHLKRGGSFDHVVLDNTFGFDKDYDSHPTLSKLLGAVSYALLKNEMGGFWAFRMAAPFMFGLLLALVYLRAVLAWGRGPALAAVLCTACMPRFFINEHLATTEAPLCLFWFLCAWAFEAATRRRILIPVAGICYGLAMSVKFTGFLLPIPLIIWALVYRRRYLPFLVLSLLTLGPLVFLLLQPHLWDNLWLESIAFLRTSTTRTQWYPILLVFRGKFYENSSPPWYYAPFMVMVTVPAADLALFFLGTIRAAVNRLKDEFAGACLIHFSFLIAITMSPRAPMYDGVRLFLPAFVFLGLIAGNGFSGMVQWVVQKVQTKKLPVPGLPRVIGAVIATALIFSLITPLVKIYPYGLEYYNELIGGVKGARKHGMETAYWWTSVNEDTMNSLNAILPLNAALRFTPTNKEILKLYAELGLLRRDIRITDGNDFDFVLILSRPFWPYRLTFFLQRLGISAKIKGVTDKELDGVPVWVLYKRKE